MVSRAFDEFNIVNALLKVDMEDWTVKPEKWESFVTRYADGLEDAADRRRVLLWLDAESGKKAGVNINPDYNEKTNTFDFTVRAFKEMEDGKFRVMEGKVKSIYKVRHKDIKRGLFGAVKDFFTGTVAGHETEQDKRDELETNLHAALADSTVLNAYIGANFQHFLKGVGIECEAVDSVRQLDPPAEA